GRSRRRAGRARPANLHPLVHYPFLRARSIPTPAVRLVPSRPPDITLATDAMGAPVTRLWMNISGTGTRVAFRSAKGFSGRRKPALSRSERRLSARPCTERKATIERRLSKGDYRKATIERRLSKGDQRH